MTHSCKMLTVTDVIDITSGAKPPPCSIFSLLFGSNGALFLSFARFFKIYNLVFLRKIFFSLVKGLLEFFVIGICPIPPSKIYLPVPKEEFSDFKTPQWLCLVFSTSLGAWKLKEVLLLMFDLLHLTCEIALIKAHFPLMYFSVAGEKFLLVVLWLHEQKI